MAFAVVWTAVDREETLTTGGFLAPRWDFRRRLNCRGKLKIIVVILEALVIERILRHLGLEARALLRVPARGDFQQAA
jgi:hypothetical protein